MNNLYYRDIDGDIWKRGPFNTFFLLRDSPKKKSKQWASCSLPYPLDRCLELKLLTPIEDWEISLELL